MFQACYDDKQMQLLIEGSRQDYMQLSLCVQQAIESRREVVIPVQTTGPTAVSHFIVRAGASPNRVSFENGRIAFSIAPELQPQFLSFIEFPENVSSGYHHHYDALGDDGTYVALDSLAVVFGLSKDTLEGD